MDKGRIKRLLAPMSLSIMLLVAVIAILTVLAHAGNASAWPQPAMPAPYESEIPSPSLGRKPDSAGVGLLQAGQVPSMSNILGATYDQARGEVIVLGTADSSLPGMDWNFVRENLAVALRAFYDSEGQLIPGVSIEGSQDQDPLDVIYFGSVTNTHFSRVLFESDRLLKVYSLGKDNLTGISVTSAVTGYMSYPDRKSRLAETVEDPIFIRYFLTPTLLVEPITTPHGIIFSSTQKLVDWAFEDEITSTAAAAAAQGFVDNFNQYYFAYAAERRAAYGDTTLYEIVQLSKLAAIAQWMQDQDLELALPGINVPWLDRYPVTFSATVTQTPAMTVTWVQTVSGVPRSSSLRGGVYVPGAVIRIPASLAAQDLARDAYEHRTPPMPLPTTYRFRDYTARPLQVNPTLWPSGSNEARGPGVAYLVPIADNAVVNGDFEQGPGAPWIEDSYFGMIMTNSPHSGHYGAIFPLYQNARVSLSQTVFIPPDATRARLTYWRAVATNETSHPHAFFTSFLARTNGTRLITFEMLDDGDEGPWQQVSFDVLAYKGQAVQLVFTSTLDSTIITSFFVDDVSLDYMDLTPPAIVTVTAPSEVLAPGMVEFAVVFRERMNPSITPTVTLLSGTQRYTLTPKSGAGYTRGYLDSDPTRWYGAYTVTTGTEDGLYALCVSAAQDLAGNVMAPVTGAHTLLLNAGAPWVMAAFPAAGAGGVRVDANVVITFSKAISINTFSYQVSPNPGGWAASWDSTKKTVTLTHAAFARTRYTVTLTQAKDLYGNSLRGAPVVWTFMTLYPAYLPAVLKPQ